MDDILTTVHINRDNLSWISYLPLSHIAGQMMDIFFPIYSHATVYFAQPDALKVIFNLCTELELFVTNTSRLYSIYAWSWNYLLPTPQGYTPYMHGVGIICY